MGKSRKPRKPPDPTLLAIKEVLEQIAGPLHKVRRSYDEFFVLPRCLIRLSYLGTRMRITRGHIKGDSIEWDYPSIECSTDHLLGEEDYAALRRLLSSFGLQDHYLNSLQQEES